MGGTVLKDGAANTVSFTDANRGTAVGGVGGDPTILRRKAMD